MSRNSVSLSLKTNSTRRNRNRNPEFAIRRATIADLDIIVKHRRNMFRDDLGSDATVLDEMERTSRPYIERGLREGWYHGWLAIIAGRVVAGVGIIVYDWPSNPHAPQQSTRAYMLNVYTAPDYRHVGIAQRLVDTAIKWARAEGFSTLWLHASKAGGPLYKKMGFETTNEMKLRLR